MRPRRLTTESKADQLLSAVMRMLKTDGGWICIPEFRVEAGYGYVSDKRVDLFAVAPSVDCARVGYEIKISRRDFNREMRKPLKRWVGMLFTNRFYFVAPTNMIKRSEVPVDCGLVEVDGGVAEVKVKAPWRESASPTWPFVGSLARSITKLDEEDGL